MTTRRIILVTTLVMAFAALSVTTMFVRRTAAMEAPQSPARDTAGLYDAGAVPDFTFTDSTGKPFSKAQLEGKVWVADFFLTSCQGACPVMTGNMMRLYEKFKNDPRVAFVSISTDPDTDSPEALAEYARAHNASPGRWHFLTGPVADSNRMAGEEGFKVGVPPNPMAHSQRFILVDGKGHIRGYYDGMDEYDTGRLGKDIDTLLQGRS